MRGLLLARSARRLALARHGIALTGGQRARKPRSQHPFAWLSRQVREELAGEHRARGSDED